MMNINKFVNSNDDSSVFHSSGFAKVAQGGALGATSSETFAVRKHREHRRQAVGRYGHSMLASGHIRKARTGDSRVTPRPNETQKPTANRHISTPPPRPTFREPGGRSYNPYL